MYKKNRLSDAQILKIMSDPVTLRKAVQCGIYSALLKHKQAGNPVCEWKDNEVVWITPEHIPINPFKDSDGTST